MEITTMKTTWKMQMSKTIEDSSSEEVLLGHTHLQPSQVLTDWSSNCSSWLLGPGDLYKINKWQFVIDFYRQPKYPIRVGETIDPTIDGKDQFDPIKTGVPSDPWWFFYFVK